MTRVTAGFVAAALLSGIAFLGGCGDRQPSRPAVTAPSARPLFDDVTAASGIDFRYRNGEEADHFTMLETLGGGVALIDYNRDGLLDIFVAGGGHFGPSKEILGYPCKLYRNDGNWKFTDVTAEAGLDRLDFYTNGCTVADYDNDGWPDLLVTGYGRMALLHNDRGKFEDVTVKAGLTDHRDVHWSTSAAFGDFNGDGFLDLYVCHYLNWSFRNHPRCAGQHKGQPVDVCSPQQFLPLPHALFLNNGDGTFRDASREAGLELEMQASSGRGLGVVVADFDDDGKLDIYVANDESNNWLYLNQGGGKFAEVGAARGVASNERGKPDGSMGVDAADYDGSGCLSLFVTNFDQEVHALYRNRGRGRFLHYSSRAGIMAIGLNYVAWGAAFFDYDLDGAEDIVFTTGHIFRSPIPPQTLAQRPVLLRNMRVPGQPPTEVAFRPVTDQGGQYFRELHRGRGLAVGDLDNDGKPDLVISHVNEPVTLLKNIAGNGHHWLGLQLVGKPNADAIGAKVTLEVGDQRLMRVVKGGGSYLSSNDRRVLFGLGTAAQVGKLSVRWPSGRSQTWEHLPIDGYWRLTEGEAETQRISKKSS